jgi:Tol biopolymer transport system component
MEARGVQYAYFDATTGHNIAAPFWSFMNSRGLVNIDGVNVEEQLFENPFYATGRPITEPYWSDVVVAGTSQLVLLQCFERRCLTYTPGNAPEWQVEAGNIGRHYFDWRYAAPPSLQGQLLFYRGVLNPALGIYVNDLYITDINGGQSRNLTGDIDDGIQGATWSPNGERIAFSAAGDLYVLDPDTGDSVQITSGPEEDVAPGWSPDGKRLVFARTIVSPNETQLFVCDITGSNLHQLTDIQPIADFTVLTTPDWSPDGQRIAFAEQGPTDLDSKTSGIDIINVDGSGFRQLVPPEGYYVKPQWSPSGDVMLFQRPQQHGREVWGSALYSVDLNIEKYTTVAGNDESNPYEPVWSPSDARIAVTLTATILSPIAVGTRGVFTIDTSTGERKQITHLGNSASWSPDGRYVAFQFDNNPTNIAITDLSGTAQWLVIENGDSPQWRPNQSASSP